ncbi:MAG: hypothetical protein KGL39_41450 [Patescibacteria group bacterium]|nr:hypothetical protein [Patescibacteria group bacterium]
MHDDLKDVIATSKAARDKLIAGDLSVKDANGIASQNHNIIGAYTLDLRERMFLSETASLVNRLDVTKDQKALNGATVGESAQAN